MLDIIIEYFLIKINLIISILFLIQYNCILSRAVVYKKAFDISRKGSHILRSNFTINFHKKVVADAKNNKFIAE